MHVAGKNKINRSAINEAAIESQKNCLKDHRLNDYNERKYVL